MPHSSPDHRGCREIPINEERIAKLRDFGLSEYAARAYLALLDLGLTEARDISALSKVPTSKIYHVLDQLHDKGLVIVLPEFPKKYAPVPFREYLEKLQREHEEAASAIERDRDELSELFSVVGDVEALDRGSFTVIRGRRNVLTKFVELNSTATRDILTLASRGMGHRVDFHLDGLRRAREQDVRIRVLLPITKDLLPRLGPLEETAEVRERDLDDWKDASHVSIGVFDEARAIIVHFSPDDGNLYQGKDVAIYTDHEPMVAALKALVEPIWARAMPLSARRAGIEGGRTPDFTRFYTTQAEVFAAAESAFDRGVQEVRYTNPSPLVGMRLDMTVKGTIPRVSEAGARFRGIVTVESAELARDLVAATANAPLVEYRHLDASRLSRFFLFDDREAFFSVARPGAAPRTGEGEAGTRIDELFVHTTHAHTAHGLGVHFEELWSEAQPLEARLAELESGTSGGDTRFLRAADESLAVAREVVDGATAHVRLVASPDGLDRIDAPALARAARGRGARVRVLTMITDDSKEIALRIAEGAEVRHVPRLALVGASADGADAFVVMPRRADGGGQRGREGAPPAAPERPVAVVRSSDPVYTTGFDGLFDAAWETATPLEVRVRELGWPSGAPGSSVRLTPSAQPQRKSP